MKVSAGVVSMLFALLAAFATHAAGVAGEAASAPLADAASKHAPESNSYKGMVKIPSGTFVMGCSPGDARCKDDEKPPHRVNIRSFWMDGCPVTVGELKKCVRSGACHFEVGCNADVGENPNGLNWGKSKRAAYPVNLVNWNEAQEYCAWRGKRLPTEAEWEYAARAGTTAVDDPRIQSATNGGPVGKGSRNPFGLNDMLGYVKEWCADWYQKDYYSHSPADNPKGPDSGEDRVIRGGGPAWPDVDLRVSQRARMAPDNKFLGYGFRCARDSETENGAPATSE